MASINFQNGTIIPASWLNDVNQAVYTTIPELQDAQVVNVRTYGAKGVGGDDTQALKNAISAASATGKGIVFAPAGIYGQTELLEIPANVSLIGAGQGTIFKCLNQIPSGGAPGSAQQHQSIWLRSNTCAANFVIDGGGFNTGGVLITNDNQVVLYNVGVQNGGTTGAQAFQLYKANFVRATNCWCVQAQHGFQVWQCNNVIITGCNINRVGGGGIWTASSSDMTVSNNVVQNCGDVGLDFEGGYNCSFVGNTVSRCKNAEMSMFKDGAGSLGCVNLSWIGNTVHRTEDYTDTSGATASVTTLADNGAIWVSSVSDDAKSVLFAENNILVNNNAGFCWYISSDWGAADNDVTFKDNVFTTYGTTSMFTVSGRCRGMKYINNQHYLTNAVQGGPSVFKNPRGSVFSGNTFWTNTGQSQYAVKFYTDEDISSFPCLVEGNVFKGFGQYAVTYDAYNSGSGSFVFSGNMLTEKPEVNGGLSVVYSNGLPKYKDQQLLVAITDSTNPTVAVDLATSINATRGTTHAPVVDGLLVIALGGVQRNLYKFIYTNGAVQSLSGSGVSTGATASASDYATFSGSTATITKVNPASNSSYLLMNLQTTY